jgi:peptidoglycan/LPS O-acetylase OafA/YrhL
LPKRKRKFSDRRLAYVSFYFNVLAYSARFSSIDGVRLSLCHVWTPLYFLQLANLAHAAVVIFFVISGFVISFSTFSKERELKQYALARLSRLYSVVVPALVLTALLQAVGSVLNPVVYAQLSRGFDLPRYFLTAFFLQCFWVIAASPPTNAPFWSLAYELWYYALFAAFMLIRPGHLRLWAVITISLAAGPEILLLLPCWLVGVGVYVLHDRIAVGPVTARIWFAVCLGILVCRLLNSFKN